MADTQAQSVAKLDFLIAYLREQGERALAQVGGPHSGLPQAECAAPSGCKLWANSQSERGDDNFKLKNQLRRSCALALALAVMIAFFNLNLKFAFSTGT